MLGRRRDATDTFRETSVREAQGRRAIVSAKLGSVSSRISDRGRVLAHEDAIECPLGSPTVLPTMPPQAGARLPSGPSGVRNEEPLGCSCDERGSDSLSA